MGTESHLGTSDVATFDPRHSHEPEIPPVLDDEGRCLICGLLVEIEWLQGTLRDVKSLMPSIVTNAEETMRRVDQAFTPRGPAKPEGH